MEEERIKKSANKVKNQIEHWFFKYYGESKFSFDGTELFLPFELLDNETRSKIFDLISLGKIEIPILVLIIQENHFIVNTTERFIKIENDLVEHLEYKDFSWFNGFADMHMMKAKGKIADFRIVKRDGETLHWKIPTGSLGIAFWNVTKKCELIGRKYEIVK